MPQSQDLQRLIISLEAKLNKFDRDMKRAAGIADKTASSIEARFRKAEGALGRFGRGFSAAFAVKIFRDLVTSVSELGDNAKRAGVNVEQLQAAIFAARQEGSSAESIVSAFSKLNLELGKASSQGNELGKILEANNISLKDLQGDPVKALLTISDLMKNAANDQDRAVIGAAALGKNYKENVPFLMQGSAEIQRQMDRGRELGGIMSQELIAKVKEFDNALVAMQDSGFGLAKAAVLEIALAMERWAPAIQAMIPALTEGQKIMENFAGGRIGAGLFGNPLPGSPPALLRDWLASFFPETKTGGTPATSSQSGVSSGSAFKGGTPKVPTAGETKAAADAVRQAIKELTQQMDDAREATKGFFSDLISGLREGASLTDTLSKAFANLADKMINTLLDQAVNQLLGPSGTTQTGLIGQLFGGGATKPAGGGAGGTAPLMGVVGQALGALSKNNAVGSAGMFGQPAGGGAFADIIAEAAAKYGLDPKLLAALIQKESEGNPFAVSPKGAMGLGQLMPGTARDLGVTDPFDPKQSIFGAADYLSQMFKLSGGDTAGALARYNFGPGNVAKAGMGGLPTETLDYIAQILAMLGGGRARGGPVSPGHAYVVGEHGREVFMPRTPGVITPNSGGGAGGGFGVQVFPSKYFDVHVSRISSAGDARTLNAASRRAPDRMARFEKLGT